MLGVSFSEIVMIAVVALIVVGPRRLPEILGTMGRWAARLRRMTTEVRRQTGIDDILREEGISGGISELRSMMRGDLTNLHRYGASGSAVVPEPPSPSAVVDAYGDAVAYDRLREQPVEGPDAYGAIPEDLIAAAAPVPPPGQSASVATPEAPAVPASVASPEAPAVPASVASPEAPAVPVLSKESA